MHTTTAFVLGCFVTATLMMTHAAIAWWVVAGIAVTFFLGIADSPDRAREDRRG